VQQLPLVRSLSKAACELSIAMLFGDEGQSLLPGFGLPSYSTRRKGKPSWCYLWSFTFPDNVAPSAATKRWERFRQWLQRSGKVCVRVLERGTKGERKWHFHTVSPQRWDVNQVRPVAERYGFGRINVKRIPAARARYVAKYIGKQFTDEDGRANVRLWACVGFHGAMVRNTRTSVEVDNSNLALLTGLTDFWVWTLPDGITLRFPLRPESASVENPINKQMEIKASQAKELLGDLAAGNLVMVGEYRGYAVRTLKLKDQKSGASVERVVVEHNVEVNGVARTVGEWLPTGSTAKDVKPPAVKGDVVKVTVETAKRFGGQMSYGGTIKPLTQLL